MSSPAPSRGCFGTEKWNVVPTARCGLHANQAAVHLDDLLHDREPDPRRLLLRVEGVEQPEDPLEVTLLDAHAGVAHRELERSPELPAGDDNRAVLPSHVLDGVRDQVLEDLRQLRTVVADHGEPSLHADRGVRRRTQRVDHLPQNRIGIDPLWHGARSRHARVGQHAVDQLTHASGALPEEREMLARLVGKDLLAVLIDPRGE